MLRKEYDIRFVLGVMMIFILAFIVPQGLHASFLAVADNDTVVGEPFPVWLNFEHRDLLFPLTASKSSDRHTILSIDHIAVAPHANDTLSLTMQLRLMGHRLPSGSKVRVVPSIVSDSASLSLPAAEFYGRWAYYQVARSGFDDATADMQWRDRDAQESRTYIQLAAVEPWMQHAGLRLDVQLLNACGDVISEECRQLVAPAGDETVLEPSCADTLTMKTAGHTRQFHGSAIIDFVLNRTEIDPDYRDNRRRLEQIHITIDSVLTREGTTLRGISLKGYASPEGSYAANERLAAGRVASLQRYLSENFGIPAHLITTDYEPEDWKGLRRFVAASGLADREALLAIIDSNLDPDAKLLEIAIRYRESYLVLLKNVFPALRHTDYVIEYDVEGDSTETKVIRMVVPTPMTGIQHFADNLTPAPEPTESRFATFRPILALKTNLLFDLAVTPNIEVEVPLGRHGRWSVMGEAWFPWWRWRHNAKGDSNPYRRSDQRPTRNSYQLLAIGLEGRCWFAPHCRAMQPTLTGAFVGLYAAGGKYDIGFNGEGYQGEYTSFGLSLGYSWPVARRWNLEVSASAGYVGGPKVHYKNEFDDARLIYRSHNDHWRYFGPTKLKVSISWLIGGKSKKGGAR